MSDLHTAGASTDGYDFSECIAQLMSLAVARADWHRRYDAHPKHIEQAIVEVRQRLASIMVKP